MGKYYDGTKLLSLKDINGNTPEIYICTTNRTGGKTTYFGRLLVRKFVEKREKFALLYRFNYELDDCAAKFFSDIGHLFFQGMEMTSERRASGIYHELFLDGLSCGYALALNGADQIKKYSHLFSDVQRMLMDEFQSETGHYCPNEVTKFISIHTSIARGRGEQVRHVPVYMISNPVSLINPYYTELGISARLNDNVRFLRGSGFVMEQGYVDSAANAQKESAFNQAFAGNSYMAYSQEGVYLNDNYAFIEKPEGKSKYMCTIKYDGRDFSVREYAENGYVYCCDSVDNTFPLKISVTTQDHNVNYVMLNRNSFFIGVLRTYFQRGCFRFQSLKCKEAIMTMLSY